MEGLTLFCTEECENADGAGCQDEPVVGGEGSVKTGEAAEDHQLQK